MAQRTLWTIGHSTRPWEEFLALLGAWEIEEVVDVRTVPKSRKFPWFATTRLAVTLPEAGLRYEHLAELGGFRRVAADSVNSAWRNASFQGYADYMQTDDFAQAIEELNERRKRRRVCIMCSEAVWWRCHRRMIADAEVARGIPVRHIMSETAATPHEVSAFAVVKKQRGRPPVITYPPSPPAK